MPQVEPTPSCLDKLNSLVKMTFDTFYHQCVPCNIETHGNRTVMLQIHNICGTHVNMCCVKEVCSLLLSDLIILLFGHVAVFCTIPNAIIENARCSHVIRCDLSDD